MSVWTRAGQSTSSAMSTDTNSPNSEVFSRSKWCTPRRSIVGSRLVLLTAQHHSKDPTSKLGHEWDALGYYLCSGLKMVCCAYLVSVHCQLQQDGRTGLYVKLSKFVKRRYQFRLPMNQTVKNGLKSLCIVQSECWSVSTGLVHTLCTQVVLSHYWSYVNLILQILRLLNIPFAPVLIAWPMPKKSVHSVVWWLLCHLLLPLVTHMVSINESISLGNALLTLEMSEVYQSRIIQSILCTRNSIDPDVPGGDLVLWDLWTKGLKIEILHTCTDSFDLSILYNLSLLSHIHSLLRSRTFSLCLTPHLIFDFLVSSSCFFSILRSE